LAGAIALGLLANPGAVRAADAPEPVELDRLLRIPKTVEVESVRYGGATRAEWQARFAEARGDLERAREALEAAREELEELAGEQSNWQMTAPGMPAVEGNENSPISYRLLQEIRRQREEVARSERRLQDLRIEANLAGVPEEWVAVADDAPDPGR
jgi:DNA repair exonuclease SbcCD ATPase subunit